MADELRTVWILGSGFSRPLGGPLLDELVSVAAATTASARHNVQCVESAMLFASGFAEPNRLHVWSDAEGYLEVLDLACRSAELRDSGDSRVSSSVAKIAVAGGFDLAQLSLDKLKQLRNDAYRLVALQCHDFVDQGDVESEAWSPFVQWASSVKSNPAHTILSFNYDWVLEKLGFRAPTPTKRGAGGAAVYKLHGSVEWSRRFDGLVESYEEHGRDTTTEFLCACKGDQIGIAVPGRSKKDRVSGPLAKLWEQARLALSKADAIVFVGYRFPPSDSYALMTILEAIRLTSSKDRVSLNIVLGPDTNQPDTKRLAALLHYTMKGTGKVDIVAKPGRDSRMYNVMIHPLWAQDFLALWHPDLTYRFF